MLERGGEIVVDVRHDDVSAVGTWRRSDADGA
jgi:hypothetical protein